jgi:hypothetical protein
VPSFASARRRRTAHLLAQGFLVLALVAGLNFLATRHAWRFDLSRHARQSLSPETRSYLKELATPVTIVVTLTDDSDNDEILQAFRDIRTLLRDFVDASSTNPRGPVQVEFIDVFRNRAAAQRHGIDGPNRIFVFAEGKPQPREVKLDEIYRLKNGEKVAFTGEQAFTAAILDVARARPQKIYFLVGHGEMDPADTSPDRGLSLLRDELRLRNFEIGILDLPTVRALPPDASLLVCVGTQGRYSPAEQELLRRHLATEAGRLLLLLQPGMPHGLDYLLDDWGVLADDVLVVDPGPDGRSDTGDLVAYPSESGHPVVNFLFDNKIALRFGPSRVVRADPGRSLDPGLTVQLLVGASPTAWGERGYRQRGAYVRDPNDLLPPPRLSLGLASERVTPKGALPFSVRGGRLVVFGDADWLANSRLAAGGNAMLALASINWLVDRDTQLNLPPRPIERFHLTLSSSQLGRLRLTLLLALPAAAAILGLLVYWNRRR